jgi:hypothetical protein
VQQHHLLPFSWLQLQQSVRHHPASSSRRQLPPVIYEWLLTIAQFAIIEQQLIGLSLHSGEVPTRVANLQGVPGREQVGVCSKGDHLGLQLQDFEVIKELVVLVSSPAD